MRPKRLWKAVALGSGLLATAPYRILAFPPPFLEEALRTSRTGAQDLEENVQPTAQQFSPQVHNFMGLLPELVEGTMQDHSAHRGIHPPQQDVPSPYQHEYLRYPAQPAAPSFRPREFPPFQGVAATGAHIPYEGVNPTQYRSEPMDMQLEHAAQQSGTLWHQQHHDYAIQPYQMDSDHWYQQPHPPNLEQPASQPLQLLQHDLTRVGQGQGLGFRGSRSNPAEGHSEAASIVSLSSSRPTSTDEGAWPSGNQFEAEELELGDTAATSDQLVHPAAGTLAGHIQQTKLLDEDLNKIQKITEQANRKYGGDFSVEHVKNMKTFVKTGKSFVVEAEEKQRKAALGLLKAHLLAVLPGQEVFKTFAEHMELFDTDLDSHQASQIKKMLLRIVESSAKSDATKAWELVERNDASFVFELGELRIKCITIKNGDKANTNSWMTNINIVGVKPNDPKLQLILWIGRVTHHQVAVEKLSHLSKERLRRNKNSFGAQEPRNADSAMQTQSGQLEQQEQATIGNRRRTRKGKEPQQPEQHEQPM